MTDIFNRCVLLLRDMQRVASLTSAFRSEIMGQVAQRYVQYFRASGSRFGCMQAIESALGVPRVKAARIRFWFGRKKGFPGVEQLAAIAEDGAPVNVEGSTDISAALAYSNHRSVAPHSDSILAKIFDDVRFGRAFIFPRSEAHTIPGLRLSPLAVVVSPSKTRIIHDLTFSLSQYAHSVNADTDFEQAPPVVLGRVLRDIIWRILYLRRRFGPHARIVLSKIDVTEAFRQVSVQWAGAPVFGYGFREWIVADRRLQFGWRSSPGFFCLFSAALEHAHRHTSYEDAVVMEQGRIATQHVAVTPPKATDRPTPLPPGCRVPRGEGGGRRSLFFVRYYVDDGILVEVQWWPDGRRCRRASASLASDHYRLFGQRSSRDPTLLSPRKISQWDTVLCVLGWDIDTVAMTISVPVVKLERLRETLSEWPSDRVFASEEELRSLIGRLLHLCEVLGPAGVELCSGVLAASSSASRLRRRLTKLIRQLSGLGPLFGG